jgi:hypothetical protein
VGVPETLELKKHIAECYEIQMKWLKMWSGMNYLDEVEALSYCQIKQSGVQFSGAFQKLYAVKRARARNIIF